MAGLLQEKPLFITSALQQGDKERALDRLQLMPYAEALKKFIESCDTPMTVGLQGDWGSGKTSMLNMLRGNDEFPKSGLLTTTKCLIVNFETWSYAQFNDRKSLPMACLYALTKRLGDKIAIEINGPQEKTSEVIGKATGKLTSILKKSLANASIGVMGINIPVGKALQDDVEELAPDDLSQQMMEFRKSFADLIKVWTDSGKDRRVVICVDDLDRIEPVIALEMLESIKNFLDVDGCVFVLAVDYEVVQAGMAKKLGIDVQKTSGKSFFDKIIQLPFNMPKSSYDIKSYVGELIQEAEFPYAKILQQPDNLTFLESITLSSVGGNPRSIKRVLNYARLLNFIRESNKTREQTFTSQDSLILYSLICMQIAWPELFVHFMTEPTSETIQNMENWDYLEKTPELKPLFDRAHDQEKMKNDISTFLDTLFDMLDKDDDGMITDLEFEPVQKVLLMAQFTSIEAKKRPRDIFLETALMNSAKSPIAKRFLNEVFVKSRLYSSSEIKYRPAGKRYVTLVYKRLQLGSLVSLKKHTCIVRLNGQPHQIAAKASEALGDKFKNEMVSYVRDFEADEGSLTGFGDAILDIQTLMELEAQDALIVFNAIITAAQNTLVDTLVMRHD